MRKSWTERLNDPGPHEIKPAPADIAGMRTGQIMLVPTPRMIDDFMRALPPGTSVDVKAMRRVLAERYGAEVTCPIYTGYHVRTVAEAALESLRMGAELTAITPFWRVLDERSPTTGRLTCGISFVADQRRRESAEPR
jgi:hypothetical protein